METYLGLRCCNARRPAKPSQCTRGRAPDPVWNQRREVLQTNSAADLNSGDDTSAITVQNDNCIVQLKYLPDELVLVSVLQVAFYRYDNRASGDSLDCGSVGHAKSPGV